MRFQSLCVGSFSEDRPLGWDPVAEGNRAGDGMARFASEEKASNIRTQKLLYAGVPGDFREVGSTEWESPTHPLPRYSKWTNLSIYVISVKITAAGLIFWPFSCKLKITMSAPLLRAKTRKTAGQMGIRF